MKHYSSTRKPTLSTHKNDHIFIRTIPPLFKACSLLCLIFLLLCKHEVIAEESSILWAADFSKSPATEFGEELEILEDGNQHLLRASTKQFLFHKQTRTPESLQWENYLVKTRFRQPEVIDFNLVIKAGKGSDQGYLWYYIQIHKDKISLICHGRELAYGYPFGSGTEVIPEEDRKDHRFRNTITFEEMGYFPLSIDEWVQVEAAVGDEKVKVTLTTDESDVREFTFDTFPGKGGARVYTNAPVDIESFSIENLDHPVQ